MPPLDHGKMLRRCGRDLAECGDKGHEWTVFDGGTYRDCRRCGSEHELVVGKWVVRAGRE